MTDTRDVGEGTWAVFAEKVVAERDAAREEIAELQHKLAEAIRERDEAQADLALSLSAWEAAGMQGRTGPVLVAERDALAERLRESEAKHNALVVDILEHLPPHIFDDDGPDNEASEREVIAHAGDEIRRLRARAERAEAERDEARAEVDRLTDAIDVLRGECRDGEHAPWCREWRAMVAERDALAERFRESEAELDALRADIREHLPSYVLDDGTDEAASERETIEYAGDEIRRLRAHVLRAEAERDEVLTLLVALRDAAARAVQWMLYVPYDQAAVAVGCNARRALGRALDAAFGFIEERSSQGDAK
jgi:predicted RNase H-like nuclease (RuvC/YqgF family)